MWFILFTIVCLLALYVLWLKPADQLPPLIPVLAVAILYIDCLYVVLWTIQIYEPSDVMDAYLLIPGAAFTVALPLLGLAYAALVLLGQGPHALIRAFSDTSDWTLSQQTSPPNV